MENNIGKCKDLHFLLIISKVVNHNMIHCIRLQIKQDYYYLDLDLITYSDFIVIDIQNQYIIIYDTVSIVRKFKPTVLKQMIHENQANNVCRFVQK